MNESLLLLKQAASDVLGRFDLDFSPEDSISQIEGWDSVAMVQILLMLENELGVVFDTVDVANIKTVGNILTILKKFE